MKAARALDRRHLHTINELIARGHRIAADFDTLLADTASDIARGLSWTARIYKFGGIGLTIFSIGDTGEPIGKIVASTGASVLAGGVALAVASGPLGWIAIVLALGASTAAGAIAGATYDVMTELIIISDNWAWQPKS